VYRKWLGSKQGAVLFAEHLTQEVLCAVDHRHVVFSIPKRIRWIFKRDRSRLDVLFKAAKATLEELLQEACGCSGKLGLILTAQTAGEALNHNCHLHGLMACGLFGAAGSFVPVGDFSAEKATKLFAHKVLKKLLKAGHIDQAVVDQILSQRHTGFSVWFGDPIRPDDKDALRFVAQYIDRGPVERKRLEIVGTGVTYETEAETWKGDPLEFLARLTLHIPSRYESVCRAYGEYSSRVRGERSKERQANGPGLSNPTQLSILEEPEPRAVSKRWSALIKKIYEVDPLVCDHCGGRMKIKSFVTNPHEVARILTHHNIPTYRAPAPIPRSPPDVEQYFQCFN